ncbi:DgyrCDS7833 [Dimorphilus gyrociliatus]|uniref:DgyrCDS7833 n=1 Tax=Dimorphilus gyrociliatus TaxID=2664684 RepID=A0A7I8VTZ7_9ANNE|nr:DgyrCDS7833 [Dimorphilus gyrociliatus]
MKSDIKDNMLNEENLRSTIEISLEYGFKNWPSEMKELVPKLIESNLIYLNVADITYCVSCHRTFDRWKINSQPLTRHAHESPNCKFIIQMESNILKDVPDEILKELLAACGIFFCNKRNTTVCYYCATEFRNCNYCENESKLTEEYHLSDGFRNVDQRATRALIDTQEVNLLIVHGFEWNKVLRSIEICQRQEKDCLSLQNVLKNVERLTEIQREEDLLIPGYKSSNEINNLPTEIPKSYEELKKLNEVIEQSGKCQNIKKRCLNQAKILSLPCGCITSCEECADNIFYCPRCHQIIRSMVKGIRS